MYNMFLHLQLIHQEWHLKKEIYEYCGVPGPPCLSKTVSKCSVNFSRLAHLSVSTFSNGLKGSRTVSCRCRDDGFYWRPRLPGTQQYKHDKWHEYRYSDLLQYPVYFIIYSQIMCHLYNTGREWWGNFLSFTTHQIGIVACVKCKT